MLAITFMVLMIYFVYHSNLSNYQYSEFFFMKYKPFEIYKNKLKGPWVIICDHASNFVPRSVADGNLGINKKEMQRHIAFDVGAKGVAIELGKKSWHSGSMFKFFRLVIDPNRGEKDPTLVMQLYDGMIIPANKNVTNLEIERRLDLFYRPYHDAIKNLLVSLKNPIIVSIHSFTPQLKGKKKDPGTWAYLPLIVVFIVSY